MPKVSEMLPSSYLKQSDIGDGKLFTIKNFKRENLAPEGEIPEFKWVMFFNEAEKGVVMNSTNIQLCEKIFGSDDTDDWLGKRIVLYVDDNVSFGGKIVGGIRVRKPKSAAAAESVAAPKPVVDEFDSDVPF